MYTCVLDSSAAITSNEGFSVVAPINVIIPFSTAFNKESCCVLLNLCISSINRIGTSFPNKPKEEAFCITSRTSLTPEFMAESV